MTPTSGLEPSYLAITLIGVLLVACVLLYLSMRRHMRRIDVPTREEVLRERRASHTSSGADES